MALEVCLMVLAVVVPVEAEGSATRPVDSEPADHSLERVHSHA